MGPDGEWERPKPPTRQFPADTDPAGVIPDHARVDLIFERSRLLSGSVGGQPVRLDLNVPTHNGAGAETIAGNTGISLMGVRKQRRHRPGRTVRPHGIVPWEPVEIHETSTQRLAITSTTKYDWSHRGREIPRHRPACCGLDRQDPALWLSMKRWAATELR